MFSPLLSLRIRHRDALIGDSVGAAAFDTEGDAWMTSLSVQPAAQAARLIEERLSMLEAAELPATQVVPALALIQDAIGTTLSRVDAALPRSEMSLTAGELDQVRAVLGLLKRTTTAFLAAAEALGERWFAGATRGIRDSALQQGALAVLQRVEMAHRVYARSSSSGWRQLLRISELAMSRPLRAQRPVRAEVMRLHTRALLFEIADPNRLDPIAFEQLRLYLRRHGTLARIVRLKDVAPAERQAAGLHVLGHGGRHWQPAQGLDGQALPATTLLLDARPLLARLERQLTGLEAAVDTARLGLPREARQAPYQAFLRSLGHLWGGRGVRKHGRSRFLPRARLAVGFDIARRFLGDAGRGPAPAGADLARISHWGIVNESPSGFGLAQIAPSQGVRIGELCCLRPDGRDEAHLGLIRRAENRGPRNIMLGVELLGADPRPATLLPLTDALASLEGTPAIRLGRVPALNGAAAIVCRVGRLAEGGETLVEVDGTLLRCRVGQVQPAGVGLELATLAPTP